MANHPSALSCDRDLLVRSLEDSLPECEEEQLVEHLSGCESCQIELERLAAEERDWTRVGIALQDDAKTGEHSDDVSFAQLTDPVHEDTLADFAVDFLGPPRSDDHIGRLDGIDVIEVIGRGGMGVVLRGFEEELNRPVVVKMLAPHLASSGAARKRFAREAQATAVIVHPNVMPILTVNSSTRLPYLVMPYMASESLQQRIDREGALETLDVLRISHQVACGLAAAHAQGLVHRDVKPANILLERGVDRVLLTDFGLARAADDASLTRTGVIAGTPQFMSPEQARGDSVDARSDLFCLGSVMYVLCAGRPPFRAETSYGVLRRVTDEEPRPIRELNPNVPEWVSTVIQRLHSKRAADRFQSANEVAELLERCLAHVQQPIAVELPDEVRVGEARIRRFVPATARIRRFVPAAALVGVAIAIGLVINASRDESPKPDDVTSHSVPEQSGPEQSASETNGPRDLQSASSSIEVWQDDLGLDILELQTAADELEARSGRLWDVRPVATSIRDESGKDADQTTTIPSATEETVR